MDAENLSPFLVAATMLAIEGVVPMFALSRRKNESIIINDNIAVTVVDLKDDKVQLGIVIPREASVYRREVCDAIHKVENPIKLAAPEEAVEERPSLDALDRLASRLTEHGKRYVNRAMVFEAILEESLSGATSLEHLKELLLRRRH
jgi:carbon storage regulator